MKDWYGDAQLRAWNERNRGQWPENTDGEASVEEPAEGDDKEPATDGETGN